MIGCPQIEEIKDLLEEYAPGSLYMSEAIGPQGPTTLAAEKFVIPPCDADAAEWRHFRFGLIVTGQTEQHCLPDLFRIVASQGNCSFKVIRRIGQRSPIRSEKRKQRMVWHG